MRNVAPSRALVRRARRLLEVAFVLVAAGIFMAILGLAFYVVPLTSASSTSFAAFNFFRALLFMGGVGLGIAGMALAVRAVTWRKENDLALITGESLRPTLSDDFIFIRNLSKRGLGYIDAVLVGPPGVLVFRTVDLEGVFLNEGGKWLKATKKGGWTLTFNNPTQDVIDDMKSLREYLGRRDVTDLPIFGVVVFIKDDPVARLTLKDPVIPATHLSSLHARLQRNYLAKEQRLEPEMVKTVTNLLYEEVI